MDLLCFILSIGVIRFELSASTFTLSLPTENQINDVGKILTYSRVKSDKFGQSSKFEQRPSFFFHF